MHPLKIMKLSVLILPAYFYGLTASVFLDPCFPAFKGQSCNMTCRVQDFSQVIDFNCNGTSRGACWSGVYCNPSIIEDGGGKTLYLEIPSLSYANDSCNWTCTYGSTSSSASKPIIFSGYAGSLILTNQTNEDKINLTATTECVYPYNTTVRVQYREEQDTSGQYQSITQQVDVQSFHVPGICGFDIEKRIVATHEVSRKNSLLGGRSVYLRMEFLQYLSATPSYTNDVGPFTFDKSPDSEENESPNTGLIVGVTVGVVVVLIIPGVAVLVYKKKRKGCMSQDDNGDLENTGSNTTKNEEGKQSPPTSASKIQLADKLKS